LITVITGLKQRVVSSPNKPALGITYEIFRQWSFQAGNTLKISTFF